jgi:hypothetical protein
VKLFRIMEKVATGDIMEAATGKIMEKVATGKIMERVVELDPSAGLRTGDLLRPVRLDQRADDRVQVPVNDLI